MKKIFIIIFVFILSIDLSSNVPLAEPDLAGLQNEYEQMSAKVEELNQKVQETDNELSTLQADIDNNNNTINSLQDEINASNTRIEELKNSISKGSDLLNSRLRSIYKENNQLDLFSSLFSVDSFSELFSTIDGINKIVALDKNMIESLSKSKSDLENQQAVLGQQMSSLEKVTATLDEQKTKLNTKISEQKSLVDEAIAEQKRFDEEYLSVEEEKLIKPYVDICNDISKSSQDIASALSTLASLKEGQIKSPSVLNQIDDAIIIGNSNKEKVTQQEDSIKTNSSLSNLTPSNISNNSIVLFAEQFLGVPYVWGATGPDSFDCSGLVQYVYEHVAGISLPRTTYEQISCGKHVDENDLQPGDLIFPHVGHVQIYIGNGQVIHAPQTGDVVKISPIWKIYEARRILA